MTTLATVQAAVANVIADLPGIGKGNTSPQGYSYRGIEAVTKEVGPLLAKHGVVLVPFAEITDVRHAPAMKEGWQDVYMRVSWKIVGPDGSTLDAQTFGVGRDNSDKGANKAMTQAFKYLLLDLLCIADTKDDADGQTYEHGRDDTAGVAASGGKIPNELRDRATAFLNDNPARKDAFVVEFGVRLPAKVEAGRAAEVEAFIAGNVNTALPGEGGAGADDATGAPPANPAFSEEPFE